jgi:peptidoglycan/LPS O-acetylase OafA/YrhL
MGRGPGRIRTVNGLRGLAALLVVFDHTVGDSWGLGAWSEQNHGITVFALLTGFLLFPQFLRSRLDGGAPPATSAFLRARAARIFPAYWVALAIAALTIGLNSMESGDVWLVISLTQTFGTDTPFEGIPPTWSLSLFFSFYLALPAWSWWRRRSDRAGESPRSMLGRELLWLLALIAAAWGVRSLSMTDAFAEEPVFTLFGRADWFAIGMILALVVVAARRQIAPRAALVVGRRPGLAFAAALALTVGSAMVPAHLEETRDQLDTLAAALLVAGAVLHGPALRGPQRVLASAPAEALGRWSFGIFLWGYIAQRAIEELLPGIATAPQLLLTCASAIVLGAASWRWIEQPAVARLGKRGKRRAAPRGNAQAASAPA